MSIAHGRVVGLVGVEFLLDELCQFDVFVVFAAISNRRVFSQNGAKSGDLLGASLHVLRSSRSVVVKGGVEQFECSRRVEGVYL